MSEETTTDRLAEIEEQTEPQPVQVREGRWKTRGGEVKYIKSGGSRRDNHYSWPWTDTLMCWQDNGFYRASKPSENDLTEYLGPIEPEPEQTITPDDVAAEALPEPQPVQVREGRWRTRSGEIRNVTPTPSVDSMADIFPWHDAAGRRHRQLWRDDGKFINGVQEHGDDLLEYLGPNLPEPEQTITPDDVAAEALAGVWDETKATQEIAELQAQVRFLKNREVTLGTRLEQEKAVNTKRLDQIQELRSEVSYVQGLLGDERRRFAELETLASDLRAVNAAQEKGINAAARHSSDLEFRLQAVSAEWAVQAETIRGLQTQLEAVKAELAQVSKDRYTLQVELDAREQVPEAVSDRFDQGFEQGTSRAVETIAEWLEPLRKGNCTLRAAVLFHLPAIMRSLTGLADED